VQVGALIAAMRGVIGTLASLLHQRPGAANWALHQYDLQILISTIHRYSLNSPNSKPIEKYGQRRGSQSMLMLMRLFM
jgi:hypothetical protein